MWYKSKAEADKDSRKYRTLADIRRYALDRAGLTDVEHTAALDHPVFHRNCVLCAKFERYLSVKRTVEDWEISLNADGDKQDDPGVREAAPVS